MQVSIIIACHSYGRYLEQAIKSALRQSIPCEVIVLDNASKDKTSRVIEKFDNIVKSRVEERVHWCRALNMMIEKSTGEYIVILGADDKLAKTFAEESLALMNDEVGIVKTGLKYFGDDDSEHFLEYDPYENLYWNTIYITSMFKKKIWEEVGGFDEDLPVYEDWDFWIRAIKTGTKVADLRKPLFFYRSHPEQAIKTTMLLNHAEATRKMNEKYKGWRDPIPC